MISWNKILAACIGGDSCCNEDNKCDVGEGDCDSDDDCLEGLKCGTNNCLSARWFWDEDWDSQDDCCYKPGNNETNMLFVIKDVIVR